MWTLRVRKFILYDVEKWVVFKMYYKVISEEKLIDKRSSIATRMVWKSIRNNFRVNEWFSSDEIYEHFGSHFNKQQISRALNHLEKRNFIIHEQKGVRVINKNYLNQLIDRVSQKDHVRIANVLENYFINCSILDEKLTNEMAALFLIEEQYGESSPMERARQQMMLIIDNFIMDTYEDSKH
jgi:hypothetical protein